MILKALDQPKARVYGTLCLDSDIETCSKWWHMTHVAYGAISVFYPVERIVLNEFKCVGSDFSRGISGLMLQHRLCLSYIWHKYGTSFSVVPGGFTLPVTR